MLDAGVPYRTVADLLGNSEVTLRLHYDGRTDTGKRDAVKALRQTSGQLSRAYWLCDIGSASLPVVAHASSTAAGMRIIRPTLTAASPHWPLVAIHRFACS